MSSSLPVVTKPKPKQKDYGHGLFNWFYKDPNPEPDTTAAQPSGITSPPLVLRQQPAANPAAKPAEHPAAPVAKPATTAAKPAAPSAARANPAKPAAPAAAAPANPAKPEGIEGDPNAPRDADQQLPPSPQEQYEKALDDWTKAKQAADEQSYKKYVENMEALEAERPNQEKFWRDHIEELKKTPLESKNMNPLLAFAAAMGAPEMTAKTVNTNNEAIASERLSRQKQFAELETQALKGKLEDEMAKGKWKEALETLRVTKDVEANLENLKRHADMLYLQTQGDIQGNLLDKKNDAMLKAVKLRISGMLAKGNDADAKELDRIFGQVRTAMSANGLQFGSEADIMERVANVYNAIHWGRDGKYFDPARGLIDVNQLPHNAGADGGGHTAVPFNSNMKLLGSASVYQNGSPPNMASYTMEELKRLWNMPSSSVTNEERSTLKTEFMRRKNQNNLDIDRGAKKTFE